LERDRDGPGHQGTPAAGLADSADLFLTIYGFAERRVTGEALCEALARQLDCRRVALLRLTRSGRRDRLLALACREPGIADGTDSDQALGLSWQGLPAAAVEAPADDVVWPGTGPWLLGCIAADEDCRYFVAADAGGSAAGRDGIRAGLQAVLPHLRQAVRLRDTADRLRVRLQVDAQVLNRAPSGFLVLNIGGTVEFANEEAEHMLGENDGLRRDGQRLAVDDLNLRELLARSLGELRAQDNDGEAEAHNLQVRRPSGRPPYVVTLLPVMVTGDESFLALRRRLLVVISNAAPRRLPGLDYLQRTFGLTPGEARVCRALCSADDTEAVALALRISVATAKTHIMRIYQKLEVNSRARLMQRLQGHYWVEQPILVTV